jgi:hypothetical protein
VVKSCDEFYNSTVAGNGTIVERSRSIIAGIENFANNNSLLVKLIGSVVLINGASVDGNNNSVAFNDTLVANSNTMVGGNESSAAGNGITGEMNQAFVDLLILA